jgi:hypothetical protein
VVEALAPSLPAACASCGVVALDGAREEEARAAPARLRKLTHQAYLLPAQAAALRAELAAERAASASAREALAAARETEAALRRQEAALRGRMAEATADITVLRLQVSRLRGEVTRAEDGGAAAAAAAVPASRRRSVRMASAGASSSPPREPASQPQDTAARVQAAVQAQLRALRYEDSQRAACPVCLHDERAKDTALNCGHVFCAQCAAVLRCCALCRADITLRVHLY